MNHLLYYIPKSLFLLEVVGIGSENALISHRDNGSFLAGFFRIYRYLPVD
jgi:hypothetical protein